MSAYRGSQPPPPEPEEPPPPTPWKLLAILGLLVGGAIILMVMQSKERDRELARDRAYWRAIEQQQTATQNQTLQISKSDEAELRRACEGLGGVYQDGNCLRMGPKVGKASKPAGRGL
jgi:type II secretory pathway pseudopilin PulG